MALLTKDVVANDARRPVIVVLARSIGGAHPLEWLTVMVEKAVRQLVALFLILPATERVAVDVVGDLGAAVPNDVAFRRFLAAAVA